MPVALISIRLRRSSALDVPTFAWIVRAIAPPLDFADGGGRGGETSERASFFLCGRGRCDEAILRVEERNAVTQEQGVDFGLIVLNQPVKEPLELLILMPDRHADPEAHAGIHFLCQRNHGQLGIGVDCVVAGHRPPQNPGIDATGLQCPLSLPSGRIDARIDNERIGFGTGHEAVGGHDGGRRGAGHDADALVLEARIAERDGRNRDRSPA